MVTLARTLKKVERMELSHVPSIHKFRESHPKMKAILWDMDGTLLNSEHLHALAAREILAPYFVGFTGDAAEIEKRCNGLSDSQLIEFLSQFCDIKIELNEFVERKNRHFINICSKTDMQRVLIPEIEIFLKEAKEMNLKLALVTSSEKEIVDYLLDRLHLRQYFNLILTRHETIITKPSPTPYLMAMERLLLRPEDCLIFEDSVVGLEAAKASGASFYQVKWFQELQGIV